MNKQEAQQRIDTLRSEIDKLEKIINTPGKTVGERFWELVSGTTVRFDFETYPNRIFGFRDDEYVWEYDFKNNYLWLRYSTVWSVLEKEYDLNYSEIQSITKNELEEHFKRKGVTPITDAKFRTYALEEHFKRKGVTPTGDVTFNTSGLEEHFKCKGVTPPVIDAGTSISVEEYFKCKGVTPRK